MRRTIDEPGFVHGDNGYRMGCGCGTCTEAQRARRAKYEDRKRGKQLVQIISTPSPDAAIDSGAPSEALLAAGVMAEKTRAALQKVEAVGAEAELVREQAMTGARMVDEAVASGRPHHVAAGIRILNESLDRLKALAGNKNDHTNDGGRDDFLDQYMNSWSQ